MRTEILRTSRQLRNQRVQVLSAAVTIGSNHLHSDLPARYKASTRGVSWSYTAKGPLVNHERRRAERILQQLLQN